ncbi:MAG: hypothetical protein MZV64_13665 [Ignavibacteriales bacterium]|nr:hypothetical protein [Ignavibacteriales bacterium]
MTDRRRRVRRRAVLRRPHRDDPGHGLRRERAVAAGLHHARRYVPAAGAGLARRGSRRRRDQPDLEGRRRCRPGRLPRAARRGRRRRTDAALRGADPREHVPGRDGQAGRALRLRRRGRRRSHAAEPERVVQQGRRDGAVMGEVVR